MINAIFPAESPYIPMTAEETTFARSYLQAVFLTPVVEASDVWCDLKAKLIRPVRACLVPDAVGGLRDSNRAFSIL